MTVTNPFTLAAITTVDVAPEADTQTAVPATPYDALCADTSRPAAFALSFLEPAAA